MAQTMADLLVAGGGKQQNAQEPVDSGYDFPEEGIPLAYLKSIRQAESNYGLPKNLLPRLFKIESNFNPKAVNPTSGASGIAQIMPKIHPNVDPFDAEASIDYAAKYLRELHDQHGDWEDALAAYGGFKDRGKAQGYINSVTGSKSMADLVGQDAGYGDTMADILRKGVTPTVNPLLSEYVDRANKSVASYAATEAMSEASERAARSAAAQPLLGPEPMGPPLPPANRFTEEEPFKTEMVGGLYGTPGVPFRYPTAPQLGPVEKQAVEFAKGAGEILEPIPGAVAGGTVGGMIAGAPGAVAGAGIGAALGESYDAWKKGDLVKLANIMTFGAIPNAAEQLNAAGTELVNLRPTAALADIAKAVPIFGPMAAAVEESLRTGQYARAGGQFLATVGLPLAGAALSDRVVPRASVRAAKEIEPIIDNAKVKAEEIAKEPDPVVQQEKMTALETETKAAVDQKIKDVATAEVTKEKVKVDAAEIKAAKVKKVRTLEQVEADKVRMAAIRAKRGVKEAAPTVTREEKDLALRAELEEGTRVWEREHPKEKKVKVEEAAAKLGAAISEEEKPPELVRPKIERTPKQDIMVTAEDQVELKKKFGEDWEEVDIGDLEDFLIELKGLEKEEPIVAPKPKVKMSAEELKGLTKKVLEEEQPTLDIRDKNNRYKAIAGMTQVSGGGTRATSIAEARHLFTPEERGRLTNYFDSISPDKIPTAEEVAREANISDLVDFSKKEVGAKPVEEVRPKIEQTEPLTEVDTQTGSEPANLDHVFRVDDPEILAVQARAYSKNKMVAANIGELFNSDVYKDPAVTTQKLLNDVNRWMKGEEVDIDATREFLSELAARADDQAIADTFRNEYDDSKLDVRGHRDWADTTREAASWARKVDRTKIEQTATRDMMGNLHLFVDPSKVPGVVKELFAGLMERAKKGFGTETPKEATNKVVARQIWKDTGFYLNPYDNKWRYELDDSTAILTLKPEEWGATKDMQGSYHAILGQVLEHPNLYKVFPDLEDMPVIYEKNYKGKNAGWFEPLSETIHVTPISKDHKATILHELQHYIQEKQGFAKGAAVETAIDLAGPSQAFALSQRVKDSAIKTMRTHLDIANFHTEQAADFKNRNMITASAAELNAMREHKAEAYKARATIKDIDSADTLSKLKQILKRESGTDFEAYMAVAGEIEARNVESRMKMEPAFRRDVLPMESEPWKAEDVIVHFGQGGGAQLYSGLPVDEIVKRLGKLHPATYPRTIQKGMADIARTLGVTDILDIFGGTGKIGRIKEYGYTGKVSSNEIQPEWGGRSTRELSKEHGVDKVIIGDARYLPNKDNSVQAIFTSPTYGNLMGLKSPSKIDSYQALAGGKLKEGNTGGMVWGPEYEQLHRDSYKEAYRVVEPGGFFVLNMKDKPVSAADIKNNWIPKKGSTVEVRDQVMRATDWHVRALEDAGFKFIAQTPVEEARAASGWQAHTRQYTTGQENIVIMGKPDAVGTTFYAGFPLDKLTDAFKKFMSRVPVAEGTEAKEPVTGIDQIIKMADEAGEAADRARAAKGIDWDPREKKRDFVRAFVDKSGNIREDMLKNLGEKGERIVEFMSLSKGAAARATYMFRQMRKEVYSGLSRAELKVLDNLILFTRIMDIASYKKPGKVVFPKGMEPEKVASYLATFQGKEHLTPEKAYELYHVNEDGSAGGRVGAYYQWMKKPLKDMFGEELFGEEEYNGLATHNYRRIGSVTKPATMAELIDKKYEATVGNVKRMVYDSGIERLQKGKKSDIFEMSSQIMALETFNRAYGRIGNNQANRTLYELAVADEKNPFARIRKPSKEVNALIKDLKDRLTAEGASEVDIEVQTKALKAEYKIPRGWTPFYVYIKGQRRSVFLSPDMAKEWITNARDISTRAARVARWAFGAPLTRTFATGIEWAFALANVPRDVAQIWWAARTFEKGEWKPVYSSHMPVYAGEMLNDVRAVFSDAWSRKGWTEDLMKYGGGMDFLVHQARPFSKGLHLEGPVEKAYDRLGFFGETSELVTRLAVVRRVVRNEADRLGISMEDARKDPEIMRKAVFAARDYMDFGTGGWATKSADVAIPYLNAAIVGMRGFFRTFRPGKGTAANSSYKLAQFAAATVGLYLASKWYAPRTHKEVKNDINNQNNMIIPLGDAFAFKDEKGQTRYPYIKIPLDQNLRFFKKFFEASVDMTLGEPVDAKGTANALGQLTPVGTSSLPPTVAAALGYVSNIDFWRMENIWKKGEARSLQLPKWLTKAEVGGQEEERIPGQTPAIAGQVGTATGLSPERLRYVMRTLIGNSMWANLVGAGYEKAFSSVPPAQRQQALAEWLARTPGVSRFFGITSPYSTFEESAKQKEEMSTGKRLIQNGGLDLRIEGYLYKGNFTKQEVLDYIKSWKDPEVMKRMEEDLKFAQEAKGIDHIGYWLTLRRLPVDARAAQFVETVSQASLEEKKEIRNEAGRIMMIGKKPNEPPTGGGVLTDEFWLEVAKLQRAGVKYPGLR